MLKTTRGLGIIEKLAPSPYLDYKNTNYDWFLTISRSISGLKLELVLFLR